MEHLNPLWVITFDSRNPDKPFQQRAIFSPVPSKSLANAPLNSESGQQALEFLSQVNTSLKNITEAYLEIAENNEELKPKADEIRDRLNVLNQWLQWIRTWLESPPKEKEDID